MPSWRRTIRSWLPDPVPRVTTLPYGGSPSQVAGLHLPGGPGPHPVVVLVHGGFWWARFDRTLMTPLALDLVTRGWAVWNIEYRRVGESGGGWPGTLDDVAAAVDHLATVGPDAALDTARVVAVGHSAGGQLALWLAARPGLPPGTGASPVVVVRGVVALAAVTDLARGWALDLGPGACAGFLGGSPAELPDRYAVASPIERLPLGSAVGQLVIHGVDDRLVPPELSRSYVSAAAASGDRVELIETADVGHFELIDPGHPAWALARDRLADLARG
jgi:acetyl esterase/lipase